MISIFNSILLKSKNNKIALIFEKTIKTIPKNADIQVDNSITAGDFTQIKNHPGKFNLKYVQLPDELEDRINKVLSNFNIPQLKEQANNFRRFLHDRRCAVEKAKIYEIKDQIREDLIQNENQEQDLEKKLDKILKSKIHSWLKIEYTDRLSHLYLASRFATDYAVLKQIFNEIKHRDQHFSPKNVFDFGSGVGTVMWATKSTWEEDSIGFFNIDSSAFMNNIANLITKNGSASGPSCFKNMYFKRNFPKSDLEDYDLVTSAFTLLDLPNRISRFENLGLLWNKVKENGYLVLVENGTKHGFNLINEAREFFIDQIFGKESSPSGHIFSPCPHSMQCPLVAENQVCRFFVGYRPLEIYDLGKNKTQKEEFPYSYIVFKKSSQTTENKWPRLVYKHPLELNGGVIHSWLCTQNGVVEHLVSSRNRCKTTRSLLKYSKMGDCLPISFSNKNENE